MTDTSPVTPIIEAVTPTTAVVGDALTITGQALDAATVTIGGVPAVVSDAVPPTPTSVTVTVPDLGPADHPVVVATPVGTVTAPTPVTVTPVAAPADGSLADLPVDTNPPKPVPELDKLKDKIEQFFNAHSALIGDLKAIVTAIEDALNKLKIGN